MMKENVVRIGRRTVFCLLILIGSLQPASGALPPKVAGTYRITDTYNICFGSLTVNVSGAYTLSMQVVIAGRSEIISVRTVGMLYNVNGAIRARQDVAQNSLYKASLNLDYEGQTEPSFYCRYEIRTPGDLRDEPITASGYAYKPRATQELAGAYTALLTPVYSHNENFNHLAAEGNGWAVIKVRANGLVKVAGRLPDNRPYSFSSELLSLGGFHFATQLLGSPVYVPASSSLGAPLPGGVNFKYMDSEFGFVSLRPSETTDGGGELSSQVGSYPTFQTRGKFAYPDSIKVQVSRYQPPSLVDGSYKLTLSEGSLSTSVSTTFTLQQDGKKQKAVNLQPPLKSLVLPAVVGLDGSFGGYLKLEGETAKRYFSGIVLQKQGLINGLVSGPGKLPQQTSLVEIQPQPVLQP